MKYIKVLAILLPIVFGSCQLKEEFVFTNNGSGSYAVGMDMSEFMQMGKAANDSLSTEELPRDTIVYFADVLKENKDSISTLSKEQQKVLATLEPLSFHFVSNEKDDQLNFNLEMPFKDLDHLEEMQEALENAEDGQMSSFFSQGAGKEEPSTEKKGDEDEMLQIGKSFVTTFNKKKFTRMLSKEARLETETKKDSAFGGKFGQYAEMIVIKQVYKFPYKIKKVSNTRAKIGSDFKSIEIEGPLKKLKEDAGYFDVEVEFER